MFFSSSKGQGLVEYALLILLVGIAVIVLLALFGAGVGNMFSNIVANI
ncbi:MAG: Flp family type IVb pilin [Anaerolineales bacterium]